MLKFFVTYSDVDLKQIHSDFNKATSLIDLNKHSIWVLAVSNLSQDIDGHAAEFLSKAADMELPISVIASNFIVTEDDVKSKIPLLFKGINEDDYEVINLSDIPELN